MSTPLALLDVLADVPDPRRRGLRHPLAAILALAVLAMLTGSQGYAAIAQPGGGHAHHEQLLREGPESSRLTSA